jgi:hypothetical protein
VSLDEVNLVAAGLLALATTILFWLRDQPLRTTNRPEPAGLGAEPPS